MIPADAQRDFEQLEVSQIYCPKCACPMSFALALFYTGTERLTDAVGVVSHILPCPCF